MNPDLCYINDMIYTKWIQRVCINFIFVATEVANLMVVVTEVANFMPAATFHDRPLKILEKWWKDASHENGKMPNEPEIRWEFHVFHNNSTVYLDLVRYTANKTQPS